MPMINSAPSFAVGDGKVVTPVGAAEDTGRSVFIQPNGKIVMGGYAVGPDGNTFALVRYQADGSLDTAFGTNGKVTTLVGIFSSSGFSAVRQPDGKILLAGTSYNGSDQDFALVRYNADGTLDRTFGAGTGKVVTRVGASDDTGASVALQPDGKIVVAGSSQTGTGSDFAIARYNADGSADLGFGTGGKAVIPVVPTSMLNRGDDFGYSVALQPDGKIVLGGTSFADNAFLSLIRCNPDGSLDTGFGTGGKVGADLNIFGDYGKSVEIQADGKLLLGGYSEVNAGFYFALVRYNTDGSLDTSFGTGGKVLTPLTDSAHGESVVSQPDGRILLGGYIDSGEFALVRYNQNGSLDTTFGGDGIVTTPGGSGISVALQADGRIVLGGGGGGSTGDFALVRYNVDGTLDLTFDGGNTLGGTVRFVEDGPAVVLDGDVAVYDAELAAQGNYARATLTLSRGTGAQAEDVFGASGTLSDLVQGRALVVGGTTIGSVTKNAGGQLVLTFAAGATQGLVDETLRQITYENTSDNPPASVGLTWLFSDGNTAATQGPGGPKTTSGTTTVVITASNDAPQITSGGGADSLPLTRNENATAVTQITASDTDLGTKLTFSIVGGADRDAFRIDAQGNLAFKTAPDFENPADRGSGADGSGKGAGNNTYNVVVAASDGKATDTQTLNIRVANVAGITKNGSASRADTIIGTAEDDTLKGFGGNDRLTGGAGGDKLYGGDGKGGQGADTFVFTKLSDSSGNGANRDTIFDFAHGDRIDLSAIDANTRAEGNQAFKFIGTTDFRGYAGELRYDKARADSYVYADVNGDKRADLAIKLGYSLVLAADDFVL